MVHRLFMTLVVWFAASTFAAGGAMAQTVAVMRLDGQSVAYNTLGQLSRAVSTGVMLAGHSLAESASEATLNDVMLLIGCSAVTPECLTELASTFEAPLLVYGSARPMSGGVELQLTAFDARVPRMIFSVMLPISEGAESELVEITASLLAGRGVARIDGHEAGASLISASAGSQPLPIWVTDLQTEPTTFLVQLANGRQISLRLAAEGPTVQRVEARRRGGSSAAAAGRAPAAPLAIAGWSSLGAGLATGALAGYFGVRTNSLQNDFDAELRQRQARELASDGLASARLTNITIGLSAALVATGTALVVVSRARETAAGATRALFFADGRGVGLRF